MQVQIRPNYKLICVLAIGAILVLICYSLYNGTLFGKAPVEIQTHLSSGSRPDWLINAPLELSSDDASWSEIFHKVNSSEDFYAVMFDAGSTGTRVHIFHFQDLNKGRPPLLVSEVFNNTDWGLGEFADSPQEAVDVVSNLLNVALSCIPPALWASTPIALKATAGLRLIPPDKAQALLDAVYDLFVQSPLQVNSRNQTVAIIDGIHEGEFIWFTVNFLNGVLGSQDHSNSTVGVLDLGGGSTQITFAPKHQETIEEGLPLGLIKRFRFMKTAFQLYTHSYLGLGLKAARLGTLKVEQQKIVTSLTDTHTQGYYENNFSTVCLPAKTGALWTFAGIKYTTWSANSPEVTDTFTLCSAVTKEFLGDKVYQPKEIEFQSFYTSSYFLGKSVESGLINRELGGIVQVKEFARTAKEACGSFDANNPLLCMDLVFIYTLLTHGYGFQGETQLMMHERIHGFETSWALGATIDLLHKHWDKNPRASYS